MPLTPEEFDKLVPPWKELESSDPPDEDEVVERLGREADEAAALGEAGRRAAVGLVTSLGNWETLGQRRMTVFEKANELLDKYDDQDLSRRFG